MKKIALGFLTLFICNFAFASSAGILFVTTPDSQAILLINESIEDGDLSKLYDQMNIEEKIVGNAIKQKVFQLSNDRFSLVCAKGLYSPKPDTTSCTFVITPGANTSDMATTISKADGKKLATLTMTANLSKEMAGIFPVDSNGIIDYVLNLQNGVSLNVTGSTLAQLTIEFSAE